jgi:hypothetical protein
VYGVTPPAPRYWKALLMTALFAIPLSLFARAAFHWSDILWAAVTVVATAIIAQRIHARMINDYRAVDEMRLETFERHTTHTRSIRRL